MITPDHLTNEQLGRLQTEIVRELALLTSRMKASADTAYGLYASCGGEIPYARLEAFPETPTCMPCSR